MSRVSPAERAEKIIGLIDAGDYDALRFIRASGQVHVVALNEDRPVSRFEQLVGEEASSQLSFLLGDTWGVCGVHFVRHRGGFERGARVVSHFPDELLCIRCHAAFGDRSVLIFEANLDDGQDPTQLGRLMDDTISGGKALQ